MMMVFMLMVVVIMTIDVVMVLVVVVLIKMTMPEVGCLQMKDRLVVIFIGPESDHWLCLSLTDSLTH